ncbi:PAQR family membrane homeostasis protein TrhA [Ekhidna sp.]|uniref:PAQR family membrane homeostasis protein TrhA n=1 Tax=Ekhidna sp. TaxID=2608089 RepID=UPI003B50DBC6
MSESHYTASEERLNVITHGMGVIFSCIGLIFLLTKASSKMEIISSVVFGLSLIILYSASTMYHASKKQLKRAQLRIFDHAAIYILIAGTYTPICLITLSQSIGTTLFYIIWAIASCGVFIKLFFTGRFDKLSTFMYVAMGWIAIFAIKPLFDVMTINALLWLLSGGVFYTLGAILYSIRSMPMNHATFHICVLGGSFCHYIMIYYYVLKS